MSPMPIASVTVGAPGVLELRAHRRLAAAGLAGDEQPSRRSSAAGSMPRSRRPLGEVERVGRRQRDGVGLEQADRGHQPVGVAAADRDVARGRGR